MCAIFQKQGKKRAKKGKIFENLGKNVYNLKIFLKRASHACDYRMHEAARICPATRKFKTYEVGWF